MRGLGGNEFHVHGQGFGDPVADLDVEPFQFIGETVGTHGRKVGIDTDAQRTVANDCIERAGEGRRGNQTGQQQGRKRKYRPA